MHNTAGMTIAFCRLPPTFAVFFTGRLSQSGGENSDGSFVGLVCTTKARCVAVYAHTLWEVVSVIGRGGTGIVVRQGSQPAVNVVRRRLLQAVDSYAPHERSKGATAGLVLWQIRLARRLTVWEESGIV